MREDGSGKEPVCFDSLSSLLWWCRIGVKSRWGVGQVGFITDLLKHRTLWATLIRLLAVAGPLILGLVRLWWWGTEILGGPL